MSKVAIACPPKPSAVNVAFLGLNDFESVLSTFKFARQNLGEILSSCEFLDAGSLDVTRENLGLKSPLQDDYPFYMLIETSGSK